MSDELKAARILFIISTILTFLGALVVLGIGIFVTASGMSEISIAGGLLIAGAIILGVTGGLKLWCANLVKEERKLTTAGIIGVVFGIIPGDIISLIAGILVLVTKNEEKSSNPATKSRKKSSKK